MTNIETAEERLQNGLHTHTVDHLYSRLNPWKKLLAHGIYESLLGDASYEYGVEYDVETFDFSDVETAPPDVDDDGKLDVRVGRPTQYTDRSLSLWQAAMLRVQALYVQPKILYENREQGEDVMESKTVESAQLTAPPSEHDPTPQEFKTLETWSEHHLNMPLSRLFSDLQDVLEYGGVTIEPDNEDNDIEADEIVLEIDAESEEIETVEETGTDPNVHGFDNKSESQKIVESTSGDSD